MLPGVITWFEYRDELDRRPFVDDCGIGYRRPGVEGAVGDGDSAGGKDIPGCIPGAIPGCIPGCIPGGTGEPPAPGVTPRALFVGLVGTGEYMDPAGPGLKCW